MRIQLAFLLLIVSITCIAQVTIQKDEWSTRIAILDLQQNILIGTDAGKNAFGSSYNTALGYNALKANYNGGRNTVMGYEALSGNQGGVDNVAIGYRSMATSHSFPANANVAVGFQTLMFNKSGSSNTAVGHNSMFSNTWGYANTAIGASALSVNTFGASNTAIGAYAQWFADSSNYNTSVGHRSLLVITGDFNVAMGHSALEALSTGEKNTVIGAKALFEAQTATRTVAVGYETGGNIEVGNFNTFIGSMAKGNVADQINSGAFGDLATAAASNQIRLGDAGVSWIGGQVNWSAVSDARFKSNVRNTSLGLDFISKLRPVEYEMTVNTEKEGGNGHIGKTYSGFIAQEVEQTLNTLGADFSGLCRPEHDGDYYSLRYAEFTVPLVRSAQELLALINNQQEQIMMLTSRNEALADRLNAIEARLASSE